jgi:ADP-ribose pyrophosphatase YjhB (NUDIX family)
VICQNAITFHVLRFALHVFRRPAMTPAEQIAAWADKLRDISAMGLHFSKNIHDEGAFRAVQNIAMEMLAFATGETPEHMETLRAPIFSHPTPFAGGDAAVIDDPGRILLIRRADNGKWAMPGGALEVGETPLEGVLREALEETGVHCRAVALVGVFDSRLCGALTRHHLYQFLILCKPSDQAKEETPSHAIEVLETRWFSEKELPEDIDPGHQSKILRAFRAWHGDRQVFLDGLDS